MARLVGARGAPQLLLAAALFAACASDPASKSNGAGAADPDATSSRARAASFAESWRTLSAAGLGACSGDSATAERVTTAFRRAGLTAGFGPDKFLRDLAIYRPSLEERVELDGRQLTIGFSSRALAFSGTGDVSGELVFASYGVVAPDRRRDDFAGVDVKGKIAVIITGRPDDAAGRGPFQDLAHARYGHARHKVDAAASRGAIGVVLIAPPGSFEAESGALPDPRPPSPVRSAVPAVFVRTRDLSKALEPSGISLTRLQEMMLDDGAPASMATQVEARLRVEASVRDEPAWAVAGVSPGTDSGAEHVIVLAGCDSPLHEVAADEGHQPNIAAGLFLAEQFARSPARKTFVFVVTNRSGGAGLAALREASPRPLRDALSVLDVSYVRGMNGPLFATTSTPAAADAPWARSIALLPDGGDRPASLDATGVVLVRTLPDAPSSDDLGPFLVQLLLDLSRHGRLAGGTAARAGPAGLTLLPAPPPFAGALVDGVERDSLAEIAGLRAGDVVTAVGEAKTKTLGEVLGALAAQPSQAPRGRLQISRRGETIDLELPAPARAGR